MDNLSIDHGKPINVWIRIGLLLFFFLFWRTLFGLMYSTLTGPNRLSGGLSIFEILLLLFNFLVLGWGIVGGLLRFSDRSSFPRIGFNWRKKQFWVYFVWGTLLGLLFTTFLFSIFFWQGWISIKGYWYAMGGKASLVSYGGAIVLLHLGIAFGEELVFRGYLMTNLREGLFEIVGIDRWAGGLALLFSAVLFGIAHSQNPGADPIGMISVVIAGIGFGGLYLLTNNLGMSIGLHFGWNFFLGHLFGLTVSGGDFLSKSFTIIRTAVNGPTFWAGAEFGPESSPLTILLFSLLSVITVAIAFYKTK